MNRFSIFMAAASMLVVQSAKIKPIVEAGRQFVWAEVPGTLAPSELGNPYAEQFPWYMNINRVERQGETVVFEVASPEAQYFRLEGNCRNQQLLIEYRGEFESETKIVYQPAADSLHSATGVEQRLLNFACTR
ncbi:hypothetical protein [Argonema galeatum]|uniref:hypothetical protein n=1 Tax=Argonema galeatum TaxID=2942762 RepID=UPI002013871C|nr:hypothetical protein [Argonema galeatum]MCL1468264.1 hypothetical protein [Argonema galeatum A003/A1]